MIFSVRPQKGMGATACARPAKRHNLKKPTRRAQTIKTFARRPQSFNRHGLLTHDPDSAIIV